MLSTVLYDLAFVKKDDEIFDSLAAHNHRVSFPAVTDPAVINSAVIELKVEFEMVVDRMIAIRSEVKLE